MQEQYLSVAAKTKGHYLELRDRNRQQIGGDSERTSLSEAHKQSIEYE